MYSRNRRRQYPDPSRGDTDILTLVLNVDRDWPEESRHPIAYKFGDRVFKSNDFPGEAYDWID